MRVIEADAIEVPSGSPIGGRIILRYYVPRGYRLVVKSAIIGASPVTQSRTETVLGEAFLRVTPRGLSVSAICIDGDTCGIYGSGLGATKPPHLYGAGWAIDINFPSVVYGDNYIEGMAGVQSTEVASRWRCAILGELLPLTPPAVVTLPATNITHDSATLRGEVTDDSDLPVDSRGFVWGYKPGEYPYSYILVVPFSKGKFSYTIYGFPSGTRVYYRAVATNELGVTYGDELYFDTLPTYVEHVTTKDFPSHYLEKPANAQELISKVEGATITKVSKDLPQYSVKRGRVQELTDKF